MVIPFLDVRAGYQELRAEIDDAIARVTTSGRYILGTEVEALEEQFAAYCGVGHAIGVGNGLDALHLALLAIGVEPGDEVIVASNTFIATWLAVTYAGGVPVPVEPDPATHNLDPSKIEAAITPRTRAILPTHLYGQPADLAPILDIARRHGLRVIEDAAQAHGAMWNGRRAGSVGIAGCFSFYPGKNLGAVGDGGAVVTDDDQLAATIRSLANHGRDASASSGHGRVGRNSRLDGLQAGVLVRKLPRLDGWNEQRRQIWDIYAAGFEGTAVRPVGVAAGAQSVHHLAVVRVPERERLRDALTAAGIGTGIHYPVPCHQLPPYDVTARGLHPTAESAAAEILSLPMYPQLDHDDAATVVDAVLSSLDAMTESSGVGAGRG
jgi:dTDP-4-amino-4,6-dideoxygalactose transaminase